MTKDTRVFVKESVKPREVSVEKDSEHGEKKINVMQGEVVSSLKTG